MRLPAIPLPVYPCALTLAGLALGLQGASSLASGEVATGAVWIALGQACDACDGWVARTLGAATKGGARLDYQADVVVTAATLAAIHAWEMIAVAAVVQTAAQHYDRKISGRCAAAVFGIAVAAGVA